MSKFQENFQTIIDLLYIPDNNTYSYTIPEGNLASLANCKNAPGFRVCKILSEPYTIPYRYASDIEDYMFITVQYENIIANVVYNENNIYQELITNDVLKDLGFSNIIKNELVSYSSDMSTSNIAKKVNKIPSLEQSGSAFNPDTKLTISWNNNGTINTLAGTSLEKNTSIVITYDNIPLFTGHITSLEELQIILKSVE